MNEHPDSPDPADPAPDEIRTSSSRSAPRLAFGVAALGLLLDVVSKQIALDRLSGRAPVEVVGELLQLQLVRNPGAAFGAGASITPVITLIAIAATVLGVVYALRVRHRGWAIALGLLLAGVVGNLLDRLFRPPGPFSGHVIDFFALPNWPVFNVADICINVAGAMIVVLLLRGVHLDGTREPASGPSRDEPSNDGPMNEGPSNDGPMNDGPSNDGPMNDGPSNDGPGQGRRTP